LGSFKIEALEDEASARANARRSLVALKDIPRGKMIEKEDLTFKRPAHGVSPKFIDEVVGKTALVDIKDDDLIKWDMFK
jgi:N-acetylneuraminate synthase